MIESIGLSVSRFSDYSVRLLKAYGHILFILPFLANAPFFFIRFFIEEGSALSSVVVTIIGLPISMIAYAGTLLQIQALTQSRWLSFREALIFAFKKLPNMLILACLSVGVFFLLGMGLVLLSFFNSFGGIIQIILVIFLLLISVAVFFKLFLSWYLLVLTDTKVLTAVLMSIRLMKAKASAILFSLLSVMTALQIVLVLPIQFILTAIFNDFLQLFFESGGWVALGGNWIGEFLIIGAHSLFIPLNFAAMYYFYEAVSKGVLTEVKLDE